MNNQEATIEALGGTGISLPGTQWFSPDSPWYSEKVAAAWPKFDYEAGQALLKEYIDDPERSDGKAVGKRSRSSCHTSRSNTDCRCTSFQSNYGLQPAWLT